MASDRNPDRADVTRPPLAATAAEPVRAGMKPAPREEVVQSARAGLGRRARLVLAFGAIYVIWGSTYLAIRVGVQTIPPALMVGLRFLTAGCLLLPVARALGQPVRVSFRELGVLLPIGLLLLVGGNGGVVWAEQYVTSGLAALLVSTVPLWMALLETVLPRGSRLTLPAGSGLAIGFLGVAVLLWPKLQGAQGTDLWGEAALLFAALCWAIGSIWSRRAGLSVPPLVANGWQMLLGGAFMTAVSLGTGEAGRAQWTAGGLAAMAYLIVFGSCLGLSAYIWLLRNAPVASVSTYAYVNPVIAVLLGWLLLDEPLTSALLFGTPIIAGSVILVTMRPARRAPPPGAPPRAKT